MKKMGKDTGISWTGSTLNLGWGCNKLGPECDNCYMYRLSWRFGRQPDSPTIFKWAHDVEQIEKRINGLNNLIFVNSMSDTFHHKYPFEVLDVWFEAMRRHPEKQFQILTKRPQRAEKYFMTQKVPENCWIGTSVGVKAALSRIKFIQGIDAKIRFVSFEPLLEDLGEVDFKGINWGIIGGESDLSMPRPMKPEWAYSLIKQMRSLGIPVWFKQMGGRGGGGAGGELLYGKKIQELPMQTIPAMTSTFK